MATRCKRIQLLAQALCSHKFDRARHKIRAATSTLSTVKVRFRKVNMMRSSSDSCKVCGAREKPFSDKLCLHNLLDTKYPRTSRLVDNEIQRSLTISGQVSSDRIYFKRILICKSQSNNTMLFSRDDILIEFLVSSSTIDTSINVDTPFLIEIVLPRLQLFFIE